MKRNFLRLCCLVNSCLVLQTAGAQQSPEKAAEYFKEDRVCISVRPAFARKASVTPNAEYNPGASNFISLGFGIDYCHHFNSSLSLITGLHGLWHGSNFTFFVSGKKFQPQLGYDISEKGPATGDLQHALLSVQTTLEKRWFTQKGQIWSAGIGLALNYSPTTTYDNDYSVIRSNWQQEYFASMNYDANNGQRPFLSAHAMAGHYWKLGKHNYLSTNLVLDYSFTYFAKGTYNFHIAGNPQVAGEYKIDGSYLGLEIGYAIPKKKKRPIKN